MRGLFPPSMESRRVCALAGAATGLLGVLLSSGSLWAQTNVYTGRADISRDGLYSNETYLTVANVNATQFGNLFSYPVDGIVSAQPLYVAGVSINGATHNVVYVATEHNSVYAFDADNAVSNPSPLWQFNLTPSGNTTVPIGFQGCGGITGLSEVGILGTPVIDPASGTLYVVAKSYAGGLITSFALHALDITSGAEKFGAPITIQASAVSINGTINFNPLKQLQRPALLLSNGNLFLGFGSNGCDQSDHGWLIAYNASTLVQSGVFITTPDVAQGGALWMSGDGPAADASGNIYVVTANGDFDINTGGSDYGDSVVKLQLGSNGLTVADYFTPFDQLNMNTNDLDLGSGGAMLLPSPQSGSYPDLLVCSGKTGTVYVVNRDSLGEYDLDGNNDDQIPQNLPNAILAEYGTPALWNNYVYFSAKNDYLKAFSVSNGMLSATPVAESATHYAVIGVPAVSANGNIGGTNGIVWLVRYVQLNGPQALYAYNATPAGSLLTALYETNTNSSRDGFTGAGHFATPIISNGKVYLGTTSQLKVYGLLSSITANGGTNQSGTVGTTLPTPLSVVVTDGYLNQPVPGVSITFSTPGSVGTFNPPTAVTNSSGIVTTQYTLPTTAGSVVVTAASSAIAQNPPAIPTTLTETATAGPPASLADVSGGGQSAPVGTMLPAPLVVRLIDSYGNRVPGIPVTFIDNGAKGGFTPSNMITTDSTGTATVNYTVSTRVKSIVITPSYGTLSGKFTEKSVAGPVASVKGISGNNQSGTQGTPLPNPLVVGVEDQYGNPIGGTTVTFSDGAAGGTFSNNTPVTDSQGQVTVSYTLPNVAGGVSITATDGSFAANYTETANPPRNHGHGKQAAPEE